MSDFRLHLAELMDNPVKTPADVQQALDEWREINADPRKWATFEAQQFQWERVVNVTWGVIHSNGFKECAIQTIKYTLQPNGTVYVSKQTHS